jgi:hypothetical protein
MEVSWLGVHAGSLFDNDTTKQTRRQAARIVPTSISRGGNICLCEFVLTSKRLGNPKSTQLFSGKKATTSTYRTLHFPFPDLIFAFFYPRFPSRSCTPCAIHLTQVPKLLCGMNVKIEGSEVVVELAHSCDTEAEVLDMVEGYQEDCALVLRWNQVVVM